MNLHQGPHSSKESKVAVSRLPAKLEPKEQPIVYSVPQKILEKIDNNKLKKRKHIHRLNPNKRAYLVQTTQIIIIIITLL